MINATENPPRIHCICVCKNEADIIAACFRDALRWAEHIIVYDGESTDGTWEVVHELAKEVGDGRVIPWKQDGKTFQESLRAEAFNANRDIAAPGDWWCHLDADEFYIDDPQAFLAGVPGWAHVVWGLFVEYYLTSEEAESLDFDQPIETLLGQLRHYRADHAEPRFFRDRKGLAWPEDRGWPIHMGPVYPGMMRFKHFKYRTPQQIQRRLDTRRHNIERGFTGWDHAAAEDWREKLADPATLHVDRGDGEFEIAHDRLPAHRGSWKRRVVQRVMHGLGVWP